MPKSKSRAAAHKTKTAKSPSKSTRKSAGAAPAPRSVAAGIVQSLSSHAAPIPDVVRAAFRARISDADAESLGTRTQSAAVESCAADWAKAMAPHLDDAGVRYGRTRYRYFLDLVTELAHARADQAASTDVAQRGRGALERDVAAARAARDDLFQALDLVAGQNADDSAQVDAARGDPETIDGLAASLEAAATLARAWIEDGSAARKALVAGAKLGVGDADRAATLAASVRATGGDARGSRVDLRDTPSINIVEGRLLFEMRQARAAFERAHAANAKVPRLVPTKPLQHMFVHRAPAAAAATPATPATPGAGAATAKTA